MQLVSFHTEASGVHHQYIVQQDTVLPVQCACEELMYYTYATAYTQCRSLLSTAAVTAVINHMKNENMITQNDSH
jgi:hypothetical protein